MAAAQTMLPEMLPMMLSRDVRLPTMVPVVGEWRLYLLRAVAVFCNYSATAIEAIVVVSQCTEMLLRIALAFINSLAFYFSTMLRLNTFLRQTLAGVLFSREGRHGHWSCSTWASSKSFRNNSCSPLSCEGGRTVRWLKSVLHAVPALCRCSLSVCVTILALSAQSSNSGPTGSIMTLCGCIRPLLSTLLTVTVYSTQVLGIIWDLSSLTSSP